MAQEMDPIRDDERAVPVPPAPVDPVPVATPATPQEWNRPVASLFTAPPRPAQAQDSTPPTAVAGPSFPLGGPTSTTWREESLTRIAEFETMAAWFARRQGIDEDDALLGAIKGHLHTARREARGRPRPFGAMSGASVERTRSNIDAAEVMLLQLAPLEHVTSQMANIETHVDHHLGVSDGRRATIHEIATELKTGRVLTEAGRSAVIGAYRAASSNARREQMRLRSFRNVLLITGVILTAIAITVGVVGASSPHLFPLCFTPLTAERAPGTNGSQEGRFVDRERVVCPVQDGEVDPDGAHHEAVLGAVTSSDVPVVMLLGTVAAGIAAAAAVRHIRGTSTPYSLPVALALVKLPTGALTAVLGLLLMRGGFVPGLSNLDTSAQILAWAVVFGYAQQLFTRLVDSRAQVVLDAVKTPAGPGE